MNQTTLWTSDDPAFEPDIRFKFRLILSWNDITSLDKFQKGALVEKWNERGSERMIETCKEMNLPVESYCEIKKWTYKGKPKQKVIAGERLKNYFFREPVLLFVRFWKSDETAFDIDNLMLKPIIDGFTTSRLFPDDNVNYLRGVFRWYEGIDRQYAQSKADQDERARIAKVWRDSQIKRTLPPPANKMIHLDFYRIQRLIESDVDLLRLLLHLPRLTI